jgi:hypothetical protein
VARLQKELNERDALVSGLIDARADAAFERCADAATSAERAVVTLAAVDPLLDADALLPASKPTQGAQLCVRCERSLNAVASSEVGPCPS